MIELPGHYDRWRGELGLLDPRWTALDGALTAFVRSAAGLGPGQRLQLISSISTDEAYTLLAFARRSAVFGMRTRGLESLRGGLAACALIDIDRVDSRDVLVAVALLHHALWRLGPESAVAIAEAAERASPATADLLRAFIGRPPSGRDLRDAWGYVETQAPGGVGFLGWGFREYSPTTDIAGAIIDIAELLTMDDYQANDPTIAAEFPIVWLSGADDDRVAAMLDAAPAAAAVSARLRPHASADHDSQQLTAFLLEAASTAAASDLLGIRPSTRLEFSSVGAAAGRLFCLLIARSFVRGVPHHETPASMDRFAAPLAAILERRSVADR